MTAIKTKPLVAVTARGGYKNTLAKDNLPPSALELNRTLPHDMEAEQGVLQACLADPEATDRSSKIINPQDFYRRGYSMIYERLVEFRNQKKEVIPQQRFLKVFATIRNMNGSKPPSLNLLHL